MDFRVHWGIDNHDTSSNPHERGKSANVRPTGSASAWGGLVLQKGKRVSRRMCVVLNFKL